MAKIKLRLPVPQGSTLTQKFGANPAVYKPYGLAGHEGIDFSVPNGTDIKAAHDGVVIRDYDDTAKGGNYGNCLCIWNDEELYATWYAHLQTNVVAVNDRVKAGETVAKSNNTGKSTGPHLHFGLVRTYQNGNRIDRTNDYDGFINPLDEEIVEWVEDSACDCGSQEIPADDGEGGRHEYGWYVREWWVEKWERVCLAERVGDLENKIKEVREDSAEEVLKWKQMHEACQSQTSQLNAEALSRSKLIETLTQERNGLRNDLRESKEDFEMAETVWKSEMAKLGGQRDNEKRLRVDAEAKLKKAKSVYAHSRLELLLMGLFGREVIKR